MPLQVAYPLLFALAGFISSALFSERALSVMNAEDKAALIDSFASTRRLTLLVSASFVALIIWRPLIGWVFLGCAYTGLGIRSFARLGRLALPRRAARLLLIGNVSAVTGITLCSAIFAFRALG